MSSKVEAPAATKATLLTVPASDRAGDRSPSPMPDEEAFPADVSRENRQGLLKTLTNAMGLDITAITLPVTINEPMSFLMRLAETFQYSELLDKANLCEDSIDRMMYVCAFIVSQYANAERTGKPFNPLLGETYELVDDDRENFRFIAEQVSHHPPVGACHCENDNFIIMCNQQIKTRFTGNAIEAEAVGRNYIQLKRTGEAFTWNNPKTIVHNVIVGTSIWFDHYGDVRVVNKKTGERCELGFEKCGWFSKGWREVNGTVYHANGKEAMRMVGKWNTGMYRVKAGQKLEDVIKEPRPDETKAQEKARKKQEKADKQAKRKEDKAMHKSIKKGELEDGCTIWANHHRKLDDSELPNKYLQDWTEHSLYIVALPPNHALPSTDSRLRPDRAALEAGDTRAAAAAKYKLETKQREEKRQRGEREWTPRYFRKATDEEGQEYWQFTDTYWREREERIKAAAQAK